MSAHNDFLARYDAMSVRAAHQVILHYSTSFSLASRLLSRRVRTDIHNLYAMVRIADEIVDGAAARDAAPSLLDDYQAQVLAAPAVRFHTDPVLHAYAITARRCQFPDEHIKAFFSSMRRDLHQTTYTEGELDEYVYGSAEVIGLLCLAVFLVDEPVTATQRAEMEAGACSLGAAFQKINFLRDLQEDSGVLGRAYYPQDFTDDDKHACVAEIRRDLAAARTVMGLLPASARAGVLAATDLFSRLTDQIEDTPAEELTTRRISVPQHIKVAIAAKALATSQRMKK
ncbi:phytoene/squalene synthase family protein [Corynebacterium breve]|uniref:Phytoene/squalene synthase family protein n=1 Tax=Corynebacterium breve TaxID=3049799 RepID=A0ABY8VFC6_9CORY|nr:phytoene/squalene synthase family protein [Corynebacterium breve]WIM67817.1 phytoene/squalene synthase family protein [Corynebacterium breve]